MVADDGSEERVDAERLRGPLARCLAELPAEEADVLYLLVWAELDQPEIAAALEIPLGTVKSRLSRARKRLPGRARPFPTRPIDRQHHRRQEVTMDDLTLIKTFRAERDSEPPAAREAVWRALEARIEAATEESLAFGEAVADTAPRPRPSAAGAAPASCAAAASSPSPPPRSSRWSRRAPWCSAPARPRSPPRPPKSSTKRRRPRPPRTRRRR